MKKIFFMAVAALLFTLGANAQTQNSQDSTRKEYRKDHRGNQYAKLDMTQAQKEEMSKMRAEMKVKREAIKNDGSLSQEQKSEQMKALHKGQKAKMDKIFTKEQKEKMKQMRKNRKMDGKKMHGKRHGQHRQKDNSQK